MMGSEDIRTVKMIVARVAGLARTKLATALGKSDQIEGRGDSDTPDIARRMQPFGFRSVPVVGSEGVVLVINGGKRSGGAAVLIASENLGYGPQEMVEGETSLFSKFAAVIILDKDGNVTVVPKAGAKVKLGDASNANLDPVVLVTKLRQEYDEFVSTYNRHVHTVSGVTVGMASVVTALTPDTAQGLTTGIGSANVLGKT
jgi:phage gp45-like